MNEKWLTNCCAKSLVVLIHNLFWVPSIHKRWHEADARGVTYRSDPEVLNPNVTALVYQGRSNR